MSRILMLGDAGVPRGVMRRAEPIYFEPHRPVVPEWMMRLTIDSPTPARVSTDPARSDSATHGVTSQIALAETKVLQRRLDISVFFVLLLGHLLHKRSTGVDESLRVLR
jgi:hypothetical protein